MEEKNFIPRPYYDLQSAVNIMLYYAMVDDYEKCAKLKSIVDKTISIIVAHNILESYP